MVQTRTADRPHGPCRVQSPVSFTETDDGKGREVGTSSTTRPRSGASLVQFLDKLVVVPVVVQRHALVEGFRRAADHGGNRGGDSAGDKVVDMLVIVQRHKLWRFHSCSFLIVVQFLDKVVDTPAGVQRQARGPDCAENRGVSEVTALGQFVPGHPGSFRALDDEEFFVIEGSWGAADAGSFAPRC